MLPSSDSTMRIKNPFYLKTEICDLKTCICASDLRKTFVLKEKSDLVLAQPFSKLLLHGFVENNKFEFCSMQNIIQKNWFFFEIKYTKKLVQIDGF